MGTLVTGATRKPAYERRDVHALPIVYGLLGLFGVIASSAGIVAGLFAFWGPPVPNMIPRAPTAASVPQLEIHDGEGRAALEATALAKLNGYGSIDGDADAARIPIERAMELQVRQGWPR